MPLLSRFLTHARLSRVAEQLEGEVLDAGCGYGELLDYLPSHVQSLTLLDRSPERLPRLQARLARGTVKARFLLGDIAVGQIALPDASFDTVVMAALLEHLKIPGAALREARRLLKPGGSLVMTTPTPLGGRLHAWGSRLGLTYREAADEHEGFFDHEALKRLLNEGGLICEQYQRFLLGMNQLVVARKPTEST
ncbi:MAG TPA: class I SAM-dependent methyltransferase [Terriglobia bacterium]|nr:class I SAM-dependent methyltransferase [Terriglobia bacterium]